jgi:hypothetical protein
MSASTSSLTRVAQIALVVNAILHMTGALGMFVEHSAEPIARRVLAAGIASVVMFLLVAKRLPTDPALVALPLAFVVSNLGATIADFASTQKPSALAPVAPEAIFTAIYAVFALRVARRSA